MADPDHGAAVVAVHPALYEMVRERISSLGTYCGVRVTLVGRAPADIALDCATASTTYILDGDVVLLAASDRRLAAFATEVAPLYEARLRRTATEVDAPLAQAVADSGGLGLAVVGRDVEDDAVFEGANALTALLGGVLSKIAEA